MLGQFSVPVPFVYIQFTHVIHTVINCAGESKTRSVLEDFLLLHGQCYVLLPLPKCNCIMSTDSPRSTYKEKWQCWTKRARLGIPSGNAVKDGNAGEGSHLVKTSADDTSVTKSTCTTFAATFA